MYHELLGAALGDIAGSRYEFRNIRHQPETLIDSRCRFTDDTVLTFAVADGILRGLEQTGPDWLGDSGKEAVLSQCLGDSIRRFALRFPHAGYGGRFVRWMHSSDPQPYNSWGNGSAMRASFCGWAANGEEEAARLGALSAAVTHNHPRGIIGAQVVAQSIYRLRNGASKEEIRSLAQEYYDMDFTLDEIRPTYTFDVSCDGSVPQAIEAFLEGSSYEEVVKLAISIGGDSDTIAAIAGSLAGVLYPIPEDLQARGLSVLDPALTEVLSRVDAFLNP